MGRQEMGRGGRWEGKRGDSLVAEESERQADWRMMNSQRYWHSFGE
jgi:hypothetical protein